MPLATILIPTHDHGPTLRYAVRSALNQTVRDVELFIIGDGVPEHARRIIHQLAAADRRVRFFDHSKHESRGEPYRHAALQAARGRVVCCLSDRDLWLPDHVARMLALLENADFANTFSVHVLPGGHLQIFPVDLSRESFRRLHLQGVNRVAFSCAAHTMAMYRRLPYGWRITPKGAPTDLYMWQQFLAQPDCRAASGLRPTAITFPSPPRLGWSAERRLAELEHWAQRIEDETGRREVVIELLEAGQRECLGDVARLYDVYASKAWRIRGALLDLPGFGRLTRVIDRALSRRAAR